MANCNDSLPPGELENLFAAALTIAAAHTMAGTAIYATVPSVFLKYFIQGLADGGFTYRRCLIWVKQTFVLGHSDYHYQHEPILCCWLDRRWRSPRQAMAGSEAVLRARWIEAETIRLKQMALSFDAIAEQITRWIRASSSLGRHS